MNPYDILNEDVISVILLYISPNKKKLLNKKYYCKLATKCTIPRMHSFITDVVLRDYSFVFEIYLRYKFRRWTRLQNWIYNNLVFYNFIEYLKYLCINQTTMIEEGRCYPIIRAIEEELQTEAEKKYKKKRIRNTRWSN